jgi:hypothetical protein
MIDLLAVACVVSCKLSSFLLHEMEPLKKQDSGYRLLFLQKTHSLLQVLPLAGADLTSSVLQGLNIRSAEVICASCYGGNCVICKPLCELKKKQLNSATTYEVLKHRYQCSFVLPSTGCCNEKAYGTRQRKVKLSP